MHGHVTHCVNEVRMLLCSVYSILRAGNVLEGEARPIIFIPSIADSLSPVHITWQHTSLHLNTATPTSCVLYYIFHCRVASHPVTKMVDNVLNYITLGAFSYFHIPQSIRFLLTFLSRLCLQVQVVLPSTL